MTSKIFAHVHSPFWAGSRYLERLDNLGGYSHEILANGGFWAATWSDQVPRAMADRWYEKGLGRIIRIYETGGRLVFKGFVNQITEAVGKSIEQRGPLLEVVNRASSTYTPRDFSVFPPVDGTQTSTIITEDTASQARYGIQEEIIEAGQTTLATAEKVRNRFLLDKANPKRSKDISIQPSESNTAQLTLDILGDVHWLKRYVYGSSSQSLIVVTQKILDVIAADPNGLLVSSGAHLAVNNYLVSALAEGTKDAFSILYNDLLGLGDGVTDERMFLGFYEDNTPWLTNIPTTIEYQYKIGDHRQQITKFGSTAVVAPWLVRPSRWVTVPDFIKGRRLVASNLDGDPRNKLIESVRFTAPFTVDLSGGASDRLSQMLAKISYTGGIY